jgi:bifunctional ADP-heptose synthase (sugar kinase/adenylyltransferase)
MRLVAALICTDYVFSFDELDPRAFLEQLKPDVHVNGAEYGENCIEADTVRRNGGRLVLFPRIEGLATTEMLNKAQRMASELLPSERNPGRIL